jgi:hypothetical protein
MEPPTIPSGFHVLPKRWIVELMCHSLGGVKVHSRHTPAHRQHSVEQGSVGFRLRRHRPVIEYRGIESRTEMVR